MVLQGDTALVGPPPAQLLDPVPDDDLIRGAIAGIPQLLGDLESDTRNVLLTLARIWTTLQTGQIRSKDAAAALGARAATARAATCPCSSPGHVPAGRRRGALGRPHRRTRASCVRRQSDPTVSSIAMTHNPPMITRGARAYRRRTRRQLDVFEMSSQRPGSPHQPTRLCAGSGSGTTA
ncbi:MAG: nucleotidyltransferase [Propionibacteriaceae bacterium]|nr:nucleotidyltransferase [Propionibacteriaceae bacterium]MDF2746101.1 nucleotidyltransferase [Propionibacteriaceae bacterium]